jgi:hypothetical protein
MITNKLRASIQGACLLAFLAASGPGLSGCGSSTTSTEVAKPDEAKAKSAEEATAAAFKDFQKTHKGKAK